MVKSETDSAVLRKEPTLELDKIQGNVLLEFARLHQAVVCLRLKSEDPAAVGKFKRWLSGFRQQVTFTTDVYALRQRLKAYFRQNDLPSPRAGSRRLADPDSARPPRDDMELRVASAWRNAADVEGVNETWTQIAFSHACLAQLDPRLSSGFFQFEDQAFVTGMADQSGYLGDPQASDAPGNATNWTVGGKKPETRADVFILIASDDLHQVEAAVQRIRDDFAPPGSPADPHYIELADLIDTYTPEHFGYCDGFSQPGILGLTPWGTPLTERQNPTDTVYQGRPGQQLIWPGSFVLGYADQATGEMRPLQGDQPQLLTGIAPEWARNGSYLVFRRLRQDVRAYREFLAQKATDIDIRDGEPPLAAMLMGRWRNGAPIVRAPTAADAVDGLKDRCTANHFNYQTPSPQLPPKSDPLGRWCSDFGDGRPPGGFEGSPGNLDGDVCPFISHIRKMYPRDDTAGQPPDVQTRRLKAEQRRILRRGLRYGTFWEPTEANPVPDDSDRGLLFLAYQASIQNQFLWLAASVANGPDLPQGTPPALRGWDPLIGQNPARSDRERGFPIRYRNQAEQPQETTLTTTTDWVIPTGGEYFFVPSKDGLDELCR